MKHGCVFMTLKINNSYLNNPRMHTKTGARQRWCLLLFFKSRRCFTAWIHSTRWNFKPPLLFRSIKMPSWCSLPYMTKKMLVWCVAYSSWQHAWALTPTCAAIFSQTPHFHKCVNRHTFQTWSHVTLISSPELRTLKDKWLEDVVTVTLNMAHQLLKISKKECERCFQQWRSHWKKRTGAEGAYFWGDCSMSRSVWYC